MGRQRYSGSSGGRRVLAVLLLSLLLKPASLRSQAEAGATLILHNGKIVTVDENFRIAEAVAISGDRILA
ncbi:MAG TPA: hypothetical protein VNN17_00050, partial [Terriglobia bacterium]|nr:hypothetical protein [Terriglobia bacterium]